MGQVRARTLKYLFRFEDSHFDFALFLFAFPFCATLYVLDHPPTSQMFRIPVFFGLVL